jgi:hypothetical protein
MNISVSGRNPDPIRGRQDIYDLAATDDLAATEQKQSSGTSKRYDIWSAFEAFKQAIEPFQVESSPKVYSYSEEFQAVMTSRIKILADKIFPGYADGMKRKDVEAFLLQKVPNPITSPLGVPVDSEERLGVPVDSEERTVNLKSLYKFFKKINGKSLKHNDGKKSPTFKLAWNKIKLEEITSKFRADTPTVDDLKSQKKLTTNVTVHSKKGKAVKAAILAIYDALINGLSKEKPLESIACDLEPLSDKYFKTFFGFFSPLYDTLGKIPAQLEEKVKLEKEIAELEPKPVIAELEPEKDVGEKGDKTSRNNNNELPFFASIYKSIAAFFSSIVNFFKNLFSAS